MVNKYPHGGGDYLARKNRLFIFKTERVSLILRIINIFVAYECLLFKAMIHSVNEKLLAFPAHLLTVCVSGYRSGFKVGAFLLGLFADGVFVFFSYRACYIMFAGAFLFTRGCE